MGNIDTKLKEAVANITPALVATSDKNGLPNVSPKGSFRVLDDEHVVFADIRSPQTISNLKQNPLISAIGLDAATRKGWRIWGKATEILTAGDLFDRLNHEYQSKGGVKHVVKVKVEKSAVF
ncbi:MAG: pyridoxamine 5'-phosphate oxidase family protein [Deltaproteobacteria bacterium]|nr:pyridoxamine 5'-phosphate oxidase family protein [Deltaproteobacteria bacterium]